MREILMRGCIRIYLGTTCLLSAVLAIPLKLCGDERQSQIKSDERVLFFPTVAHWDAERQLWNIPIHGWIFEPEKNSISRRIAKRKVRSMLGLDPHQPATDLFEQRMNWFLVDNERGKIITVSIADRHFTMERSGVDGHFHGTAWLPPHLSEQHANDGRLTFHAITRPDDPRSFSGAVELCQPTGTSVISDIDDTIKVSDVRDRMRLLRRTFLEPFRDVEGMSDMYRRWAAADVQFHYVSASPWQFFQPLSEFLNQKGFPHGSFHLRRFRLLDATENTLFDDPVAYKQAVIEKLLATFPQRRFVLVGDSGQKDPEVYGIIARQHSQQVAKILIRDITDQPRDMPRYQTAFQGISANKWLLFQDAEQLNVATVEP